MNFILFLVLVYFITVFIAKLYKEKLLKDEQKRIQKKDNYQRPDYTKEQLSILCLDHPNPESNPLEFEIFISKTEPEIISKWYHMNKYMYSFSEEQKALIKKRSWKQKIEVSVINHDLIKDFISIDFEIATFSRMACQVGIVEVENLIIKNEHEFLIKPPFNSYDEMYSQVHGLNEIHTLNAPSFEYLYEKLKNIIENKHIVAHNAFFDLDVLNKNIQYYSLSPIGIKEVICTSKLHGNKDLLSCCNHYNIEISGHHSALNDARAAAEIFIRYVNTTEHKMVEKLNFEVEIEKDNLKQDLDAVENKNTIFYNKKVVITGVFLKYPSRNQLAARLKSLGADINTSISSKTDIVIAGNNCGPKKMEKVYQINAKGGSILIFNEKILTQHFNAIQYLFIITTGLSYHFLNNNIF